MSDTPSLIPNSRTLIHPGPFEPVRIQTLRSQRGRHTRLLLQPGKSLFEALIEPLYELGINSASTTILGGLFTKLLYCVAPPDPSGKSVIAYSHPIDAGSAYMIFGNATVGKTNGRLPLVHCHAAIRTECGLTKGGHVLPQQSIIGSEPISVLVTSLDDFELRVGYDAETNVPLLQPYKEQVNE